MSTCSFKPPSLENNPPVSEALPFAPGLHPAHEKSYLHDFAAESVVVNFTPNEDPRLTISRLIEEGLRIVEIAVLGPSAEEADRLAIDLEKRGLVVARSNVELLWDRPVPIPPEFFLRIAQVRASNQLMKGDLSLSTEDPEEFKKVCEEAIEREAAKLGDVVFLEDLEAQEGSTDAG